MPQLARSKPIEPPGELLSATRDMLINRPTPLTLAVIVAETNLPYAWLLKLHNDPDCRPAVHRVEALHKYLTIKKHEAANVSS